MKRAFSAVLQIIKSSLDYLYPGGEIYVEYPAVAVLLKMRQYIDPGRLLHCIHE